MAGGLASRCAYYCIVWLQWKRLRGNQGVRSRFGRLTSKSSIAPDQAFATRDQYNHPTVRSQCLVLNGDPFSKACIIIGARWPLQEVFYGGTERIKHLALIQAIDWLSNVLIASFGTHSPTLRLSELPYIIALSSRSLSVDMSIFCCPLRFRCTGVQGRDDREQFLKHDMLSESMRNWMYDQYAISMKHVSTLGAPGLGSTSFTIRIRAEISVGIVPPNFDLVRHPVLCRHFQTQALSRKGPALRDPRCT